MAELRSRGLVMIDGVLGDESLGGLRRAAHELEGTMVAGSVGLAGSATAEEHPSRRPETRRDRVVRLPAADAAWWHHNERHMSPPLRTALAALHRVLIADVHRALLPLWPSDRPPLFPRESLQFACYGKGDFYQAHEDRARTTLVTRALDGDAPSGGAADQPQTGLDRAYTAIYYANGAEPLGGELRLWPDGAYAAVDVRPVGDRLVVFDSSLLHEVLPNEDDTQRCAFTMWFSSSSPINVG